MYSTASGDKRYLSWMPEGCIQVTSMHQVKNFALTHTDQSPNSFICMPGHTIQLLNTAFSKNVQHTSVSLSQVWQAPQTGSLCGHAWLQETGGVSTVSQPIPLHRPNCCYCTAPRGNLKDIQAKARLFLKSCRNEIVSKLPLLFKQS